MRRLYVVATVVLFFVLLQWTGVYGEVAPILTAVPWWVFFVIAAIGYCAYRVWYHSMEDRKLDHVHIEEEGKVYMNRLEEEKKRRKQASGE
ncbi:sporulation YhaL family protein [Alkalihalobacillus sp. AL-G]|uniref:sporulation YhaL family protein n=1 Tax=Alkalihalobacillus sp. AL-G TaxID=2926399 RepID=UPI00272A123B|nr:sporulation YhaL family protein [Alkalihalobacillus sp. AL-G]WLD94070.1 sporulation YhaL family protein [Alkalihalobacillus sp. AL-G]